ncbi:MAG: glycosyltransferase family 2 protein [Parachlamydiales bacterium]|jgi:glycosyltransferase involved in cell wall biosynthesis
MQQVKYSVVIPMKNEENNVGELIKELEPIMESLKQPWELICINDGSTDSTLAVLKKLMQEKPYLRILNFDRNYGQSSAFDAGFRASRGEFTITMDGDLQNDPADIPKLLHIAENADLVCGQRVKRKDSVNKKVISWLGNVVRSRFCQDGVKDTGCSLKVFRTLCLNKIKMYQGMHRFLPALFKIEGLRITEVPVNHRHRKHGKTKYNLFNRSFNTIADMLAVRWMRNRHLKYKIEKEVV